MQVLLVIGGNHPPKLALIPFEKLKDYDLDLIDGESDLIEDQIIGDQVSMILDRLGLQPFMPFIPKETMESEYRKHFPARLTHEAHPFKTDQDLKEYLDPVGPFKVTEVVTIMMMGS